MLLGKKLRRRQKHGLRPAPSDLCAGHQRHGGLSATNVPLKQALHGRVPAEGGTDLVHRAPLGGRKLEWKDRTSARDGLRVERLRVLTLLRCPTEA